MYQIVRICLPLVMMITASCGVVNSVSHDLSDAAYVLHKDKQESHVWLREKEDGFILYPISSSPRGCLFAPKQIVADTISSIRSSDLPDAAFLTRSGPDVDFLTFPAKYRPAAGGVPPQFSTNLNGAFYLGFRRDSYRVHSRLSPDGSEWRRINHFGLSAGLFSGLGSSPISATTTAGRQALEYDGLVFTRGLAVLAAVNRFTVGLAVGKDRLTDGNNRIWVYRNKTWAGVVVGLNIN